MDEVGVMRVIIIIVIDAKTETKVEGKEKEFRYINTTDVNRKKGD